MPLDRYDRDEEGVFASDAGMYRLQADQDASWMDHYRRHVRREQPGCEWCRETGLSPRLADERAEREEGV